MGNISVNPTQAIPLSNDTVGNEFLTKDISDQEILDAIKQINPLKAPSPEGMQVIFYKKKI